MDGQLDVNSNIGPRDITRAEREIDVYVPCPFAGPYSPSWKINNIVYEAFNLPERFIPASYGLLITVIEKDMDGTTFQCLVYTGVNYTIQYSSIGKLTVVKTKDIMSADCKFKNINMTSNNSALYIIILHDYYES